MTTADSLIKSTIKPQTLNADRGLLKIVTWIPDSLCQEVQIVDTKLSSDYFGRSLSVCSQNCRKNIKKRLKKLAFS